MTERRWTLLLVPHDADSTRAVRVSGTAMTLVTAFAAVVVATALVAAIGIVSHSQQLSRALRAERANRALAGEVGHLSRRVDVLSDSIARWSRTDSVARLVSGLDPLSADVLEAGIGGPIGAWPERDRLLAVGGVAGREAFGTHLELNTLVRRADILVASLREAEDSLIASHRRLNAKPDIMPTAGFITSRFSAVRYHPILHENLPHLGVDIAAAYGARILAPAAGRVVRVGRDGGYGLMVEVDHGYGIETRYAHMSQTVAQVGQLVKRGDLLGYVGSTGLSTGPHLHYEVRVNGKAVDPLRYVLPPDFGD
jgi:murein DD-endopeptidase MepM/ murein hydrolase activator NlpD